VVADPRAGRTASTCAACGKAARGKGSASGLHALLATGTLDSTVRMGFLTFLPFLLKSKGAGTAGIGIALSLLFVGGAFGKLLCGYLGAHRHDENGVGHRVGHLACIVAAVFLPLTAVMGMLPLLGLALNGTSSVLYGWCRNWRRRQARTGVRIVLYRYDRRGRPVAGAVWPRRRCDGRAGGAAVAGGDPAADLATIVARAKSTLSQNRLPDLQGAQHGGQRNSPASQPGESTAQPNAAPVSAHHVLTHY
jgi:hypothetical protein